MEALFVDTRTLREILQEKYRETLFSSRFYGIIFAHKKIIIQNTKVPQRAWNYITIFWHLAIIAFSLQGDG